MLLNTHVRKKTLVVVALLALALGVAMVALEASASAAGITEGQLQGIYAVCLRAQTRELKHAIIPDNEHYPLGEYAQYSYDSYSKPLIGRDTFLLDEGYRMEQSCTNWPEPEMRTELAFRSGRLKVEAGVNNYSCSWESGTSHFYDTSVKTRPIYIPFYRYKTESETRVEETADALGRVTRTVSELEHIRPDSLTLVNYVGPRKLVFANDDTGRAILGSDRSPITFDVDAYQSCLTGYVRAELAKAKPSAASRGVTTMSPAEAGDARTSAKSDAPVAENADKKTAWATARSL